MNNSKLLTIRLGTRKSPMAIAVAEHARRLIESADPNIQIIISEFTSEGDQISGSLREFGGKGTFIKDLERRLLGEEIDCAIHALKDIPGDIRMHNDLTLIAFLAREDAKDALVLRTGLAEIDSYSAITIGTSAPRRQASIRRMFPNATIALSRGNVNTRVSKLDAGEFDALILSGAGLERVGLGNRISKLFTEQEILPAAGQSILCLQIRKADYEKLSGLRKINDSWSQNAAAAERAVLFELKGNCHSAIAAHCRRSSDGRVELSAIIFDGTGTSSLSAEESRLEEHCDFEQLGICVAKKLIEKGGLTLL